VILRFLGKNAERCRAAASVNKLKAKKKNFPPNPTAVTSAPDPSFDASVGAIEATFATLQRYV